jgi:hypothetical protein
MNNWKAKSIRKGCCEVVGLYARNATMQSGIHALKTALGNHCLKTKKQKKGIRFGTSIRFIVEFKSSLQAIFWSYRSLSMYVFLSGNFCSSNMLLSCRPRDLRRLKKIYNGKLDFQREPDVEFLVESENKAIAQIEELYMREEDKYSEMCMEILQYNRNGMIEDDPWILPGGSDWCPACLRIMDDFGPMRCVCSG